MAIARSTIQSTITTVLATVTGVDPLKINTDFENAENFEEIIREFTTDDNTELQNWRVRRIRYAPNTAESTDRQSGIPIRHSVHWDATFEVIFDLGYRATNEERFQTIIDAVLTAFQPRRSYGVWSATKPLGLDQITTGDLGGLVLTRRAIFSVTVTDPQNGISPI